MFRVIFHCRYFVWRIDVTSVCWCLFVCYPSFHEASRKVNSPQERSKRSRRTQIFPNPWSHDELEEVIQYLSLFSCFFNCGLFLPFHPFLFLAPFLSLFLLRFCFIVLIFFITGPYFLYISFLQLPVLFHIFLFFKIYFIIPFVDRIRINYAISE